MKQLPIAIALGLALLALGCRSNGGQELVERELRWQEDRIRHLEAHICECEQQLEACQLENAELKRKAGSGIETPVASPAPQAQPPCRRTQPQRLRSSQRAIAEYRASPTVPGPSADFAPESVRA